MVLESVTVEQIWRLVVIACVRGVVWQVSCFALELETAGLFRAPCGRPEPFGGNDRGGCGCVSGICVGDGAWADSDGYCWSLGSSAHNSGKEDCIGHEQ